MLLPSPWCDIAMVLYLAVVFVGGIYVILGKVEQEKETTTTLNLTEDDERRSDR